MKMYIEIPKGTEINTQISNKKLILQEDIKIPITTEIIYEAEFPELEIFENSYNLNSLIDEIKIDLGFNYDNYGLEQDDNLYGDAIKLKYKMLEILKEV